MTSRRLTAIERTAGPAGAMSPAYATADAETFHVLEGELTFFLGRETVRAAPGDVVAAPGDLPRALRVEAPGTRWVVATKAVSPARFEDFGRALARPLGREGEVAWATAEDEATVTALAAQNGIRVLGPPGALPGDL